MQTKEYPLFVLQLFAPGLSAVLSVFCSPVHENVLRWKLCFPCLFPAIWIRRCYNNTDEDYSSILLVFSLLFCSVLLLDSDGKSGFCGNCFRGYCVQCVWVLACYFFVPVCGFFFYLYGNLSSLTFSIVFVEFLNEGMHGITYWQVLWR